MLRANKDETRGGMWEVMRAPKIDGAGVGNQQTNRTHWHQGLGPGGQLKG